MTKRRIQIVSLVAHGEDYKTVSKKLFIAKSSIRNSMVVIREILRAKSNAHAVYLWLKAGGKINESQQ